MSIDRLEAILNANSDFREMLVLLRPQNAETYQYFDDKESEEKK